MILLRRCMYCKIIYGCTIGGKKRLCEKCEAWDDAGKCTIRNHPLKVGICEPTDGACKECFVEQTKKILGGQDGAKEIQD